MPEDSRIRIPLLNGEYSPLWKIRSRAQMLFLDTVVRVAPAPLYSLRADIFPKYLTAFEFERKRDPANAEIGTFATRAVGDLLHMRTLTNLQVPREVKTFMRSHRLLYDAGSVLIDWSQNFNLRGKRCRPDLLDDNGAQEATLQHRCWPLVVALQTILFWSFHSLGCLWRERNPPSWCPPVLTLREPPTEPEHLPPIELRVKVPDPSGNGSGEIEVPGWYIELEKESQFRTRMKESFDRWLKNYIEERGRSARAAGFEKVPGKRKLILHFAWAAKYQILKCSPAKIAREYGVDEDTVDGGIEAALDLIHLERRAPSRGGLKGERRLPE